MKVRSPSFKLWWYIFTCNWSSVVFRLIFSVSFYHCGYKLFSALFGIYHAKTHGEKAHGVTLLVYDWLLRRFREIGNWRAPVQSRRITLIFSDFRVSHTHLLPTAFPFRSFFSFLLIREGCGDVATFFPPKGRAGRLIEFQFRFRFWLSSIMKTR